MATIVDITLRQPPRSTTYSVMFHIEDSGLQLFNIYVKYEEALTIAERLSQCLHVPLYDYTKINPVESKGTL